MATGSDILIDAMSRVREVVHAVLDGLEPDHLTARVDPQANTIAWLVWHLTRVEDDHVADAAAGEQVWTAHGWKDRFALDLPEGDIGFGHTAADVARVRADADTLLGYHDEVHQHTVRFLEGLDDAALDRVVDESWDPPVTLAVRLVSVVSDCLQHAGQAAYVRGVLERS